MTNILWCWWTTVLFCNYVQGSDEPNSCLSAASKLSIPMVNFCENKQASNDRILIMDGSLAESIPTVTSCSCLITTSLATTLYFSQTLSVPLEITTGCGSEISVQNSNGNAILMSCNVQGSMKVTNDEYLNVVLIKNRINVNTKYCVYISQGDGSARIDAKCSNSTDPIGTDITTSTSPTYVTQYSTEQISANIHILTEKTSTRTLLADTSSRTSATQSSTSTSTFLSTYYTRDTYNTSNKNTVIISSDNNMIMYFAIGGGGGGAVVVTLLIVTVVLCRRCSSKQSQKHEESDEDESDELQYNMLYVSSGNTVVDTNTADQHRLSHNPDTEVTYSTVDIEDDVPYIKNTILQSTPITRKCVVSEPEDTATVQQSAVTHVIASGGGSEYAVVNKQEKNNVTDSVGNTYAVVDKT